MPYLKDISGNESNTFIESSMLESSVIGAWKYNGDFDNLTNVEKMLVMQEWPELWQAHLTFKNAKAVIGHYIDNLEDHGDIR